MVLLDNTVGLNAAEKSHPLYSQALLSGARSSIAV